MEWSFAIGMNVNQPAKNRDILCLQSVSAWAKQIQRLAVHKENSFLTFVYDQLRSRIEILARMFPYESAVITFIFDDASNSTQHASLPLFL
jgi:hypothetical protein